MDYGQYYKNTLDKLGVGRRGYGIMSLNTTATFNSLFKHLIGTDITEIYKLLGGSINSADGFYCFYCENKGERENCEQCEDGQNWCDEGCEEGYFTCEQCEEGYVRCEEECVDGKLLCAECAGDGEIRGDCGDCDGEGTQECKNCDGEGTQECSGCDGEDIICISCEGEGVDEKGDVCSLCEGEQIECKDCDGSWVEECGDCKGEGVEKCDNCDGRGDLMMGCGDCAGDGVYNCEECEHDGWNDCPDWDCNDGIITCEECEEGVIECDNCEGEWHGGICGWCRGREYPDLMTNMGDWNNLTPSVASFSKIMNDNEFPDLKWIVREEQKEEIKPSSITSDTIFMFHEPTWISQNPTLPPQLHIHICVVSLAAPVRPNEESEGLEANYKQLILTLGESLDNFNKILQISSYQMSRMPFDPHNGMWRNQNAKALSLKSNINFTQKGLMNWNTPTPWL